jgi:hypothetical protein
MSGETSRWNAEPDAQAAGAARAPISPSCTGSATAEATETAERPPIDRSPDPQIDEYRQESADVRRPHVRGLLGTAALAVRAWRLRAERAVRWRLEFALSALAIAALSLASVVVACYRIDYQVQGRYLFPAIAPVALAIVAGWEELAGWLSVRRLAAPLLVVVMVLLMVAFAAVSLRPVAGG